MKLTIHTFLKPGGGFLTPALRVLPVTLYVLFILLTAAPSHSAQISEMQVKNILPGVENLEGGSELWLNTGIRKKTEDNHTVYSTTYSFYSGKSKKMMNIIRKGQYETNVALYSFNNFVDASQYFHMLTKDAPKKTSQQVRFGERGLFFLEAKSGYINDADFYLVFINKTFVVWIYSNDGFALMDIANPINAGLNSFILDNTQMYLIKKLTLEAHAEGYELQTKQLSFLTDFPASIKVSGKVFSKEIDPLPVATVNILETGDSFYTDKNGYFEHTILLDGIDDIELSANFYLDMDEASRLTSFKGGFFESGLRSSRDGQIREQMWNLETSGEKIFGNSYIQTSSGLNAYPVRGSASGDEISLTLDCRRAGSDFGCEQVFSGRVTETGIAGEWSGTGGGGTFEADGSKFSPTDRKIILSGKTGEIRTYSVDADGKLLKSADSLVNIGAGSDSSSMIYVEPILKNLKLDPAKTVSAKLVLTHLPDNQSGNLSVFTYRLRQEGTAKYLGAGRYAGQVYPGEEPYRMEIDITDILETGEPFVVGTVPEAGSRGNHVFSPSTSGYEDLKPAIVITEYSESSSPQKTERPFVMINRAKESADLIGDRNKPGPDGTPDYCYDAVISYPGRKLTGFELEITGDIRRRYNTNPLDIYPLVGFIKGTKLVNKPNGSLDEPLEKVTERFGICVNGSYAPKLTDGISYKYYIDGKPVEGILQ